MQQSNNKRVIIIGGGFAGVSAARALSNKKNIEVFLVDRRNHHLFQPLLYQVAMAGLNPSDIATPLRRIFTDAKNVQVIMSEVEELSLKDKKVLIHGDWMTFDYLIIACGSKHSYFGQNDWEEVAPGLKSIEQATEIRRRVLMAFEHAENEEDESKRKKHLTFAVVGGGPTGVELAGAIAEMSKQTLYKDYRHADLKKTRVVLIESGPRVLGAFPESLSRKAKEDLEGLGVEVVLNQRASDLSKHGLKVGHKYLETQTIIWAAGVKPSKLTEVLTADKSKDGRVLVKKDLSIEGHPEVFVLGDQAAFQISNDNNRPEYLPGLAPVAIQQGKFVGKMIVMENRGGRRGEFKYLDKGIMATIGRTKAVVSTGPFKLTGFIAWLIWVFIHIAYLIQVKNRVFVLLQWSWSYFSFGKGARLITHKSWRFYSGEKIPIADESTKP